MDLSRKTLDELKQIAKANNIKGYSTLRKPALIRYLESFETAPVCEKLRKSEVLHLAKKVGVNPRKTIEQLCAEISAKTQNLSKLRKRYPSPSIKKSNPLKTLREKLLDLLYNMTPLSDEAIKEIMECARMVVAIRQGKVVPCYFKPAISAQQIYKDLIRILESGVIADLYTDYVNDPNPGPIPENLEKILVGEAILATFGRYVEMLNCSDGIDYIYSDKLVRLLKEPEDDY